MEKLFPCYFCTLVCSRFNGHLLIHENVCGSCLLIFSDVHVHGVDERKGILLIRAISKPIKIGQNLVLQCMYLSLKSVVLTVMERNLGVWNVSLIFSNEVLNFVGKSFKTYSYSPLG